MMNVYQIKTSDLEKARALGFVLYIEGISTARDSREEGNNVAMQSGRIHSESQGQRMAWPTVGSRSGAAGLFDDDP